MAVILPAIGEEVGMRRVIFACIESAGRSQMAAEFFNQLANPAHRCLAPWLLWRSFGPSRLSAWIA